MKEIKINDYVLVSGEGDEVFRVIGMADKTVILETGIVEPKRKCTPVPRKFHYKLSTVSHTYLDFDSINEIMER
jgi:hypothetical protein